MKLNPANIATIKRLLVGRNSRPLRSIIQRLKAADLASLLMQLHRTEKRRLLQALIAIHRAGEVMVQLPESQLKNLLLDVDSEAFTNILKHSSINDGSLILQHTDSAQYEISLQGLEAEKKEKLLQFLNYPEESVGRMMNSHFFTMPNNVVVGEALRILREKAKEESIYYIYCVDESLRLTGVVSLRDLATSDPEVKLPDITKLSVISVSPIEPVAKAAQLVSHYDFVAIPVTDVDHRIIGIITVDDVLDIIEEQATADIYASAGLAESDRVYSPILEKIYNRTPWMMLNLLLSGVASAVLYQFEHILDELVLLAITKNIVTSTGGNAAIQSLTVTTRGMAVNDFQFITPERALARETLVGMTMGIITGAIAGLAIFLWKGQADYGLMVGSVMFISMILTSLVAASFGAGIPLILKKLNRDPAVGSGVIVTVITDIFGFFSFLGLASLVTYYFEIS